MKADPVLEAGERDAINSLFLATALVFPFTFFLA